MKFIDRKKIKNSIFKSKIKTFIKNIYININNFNFLKFLYYYKLFLKNIDIAKKKNFKNKKSSRLKKRISSYIKKKLFF